MHVTLINEPGLYLMRNGFNATVHEIKPGAWASVKGARHRLFRGKIRPNGYFIWHVSGRAYPLKESQYDIVAKVERESE